MITYYSTKPKQWHMHILPQITYWMLLNLIHYLHWSKTEEDPQIAPNMDAVRSKVTQLNAIIALFFK
ncbi:hypothetical protein [Candidatus Symbiopectobacterium sp.]|uniref:hypothetical protein n=1 Tax=Candidatus Symbiopectobacterium sp. TaxID=2816440 RepID=UPI0025BC41E4|nr:hypothetical protein [Candidatus Symbiopectobacterium sp.]